VQSGPPNASALDRAAETTAKLVAELGAPSPAALRDVPTQALLDAQAELMLAQRRSGLPLVPVVDGASIPVAPLQALRDGVAADVDVLIGTNRDEAKMFMVMDPASREPDEGVLHRKIESIFRHNDIALSPHDVIDAYRAARSARGQAVTPRELWSAIDSDRVFRIGSIRAAEAMSSHRRTWMYLFDWESPAMGGALGACHALEIPFVFGTLDTPGIDRFAGAGDDAKALSATMMDAWLAFACAGDPGWTPYEADRRSTQVFGPRVHLTEAPYDAERQVWQTA
jgi:para-nitrobenzyl esterase